MALKSQTERAAYVETVGTDGFTLLDALEDAPVELKERPLVNILVQAWARHFEREEGVVRSVGRDKPPPLGGFIESPYDPETRYSAKGSVSWVGYKVHLVPSV